MSLKIHKLLTINGGKSDLYFLQSWAFLFFPNSCLCVLRKKSREASTLVYGKGEVKR